MERIMRGLGSSSVSRSGDFVANVSGTWRIAHGLAFTLIVALASSPAWAQGPATTAAAKATRTEKDLLGEKQIPADAYYGAQTAPALENLQLAGVPNNHYPRFIQALVAA